MSAIYNFAAQNALEILKGASREASAAQKALASGKRVADASDNAALWAVAEGFRAQLSAISALNDTLNAGQSTVAVSRAGAESVSSLLSDVKTEIIAATAAGADTDAIQSTIDDLVAQVETVVSSSSFNGVNLLQNRLSTDTSSFSVLAALRTDGGTPTSYSIDVAAQDLQTTAEVFGTSGVATLTDYFGDAGGAIAAAGSDDVVIDPDTVASGASYRVRLSGAAGHAFGTSNVDFEYVARPGDDAGDVAKALERQIADHIDTNGLEASLSVAVDTSTGTLTINNLDGANAMTLTNQAFTGGVAGGALSDLSTLDVTSANGRTAALVKIDTLIEVAANAATALGSSENRITTQLTFNQSLDTVISTGLSALVDADLEAESARLAAAQAQESLAIEMLAIANARNERILSLFQTS